MSAPAVPEPPGIQFHLSREHGRVEGSLNEYKSDPVSQGLEFRVESTKGVWSLGVLGLRGT